MKKRKISVKFYLYSLLIAAILFIAVTIVIISYRTSISQINDYYNTIVKENATNVSTYVDSKFLFKFRKCLESEEYQAVRQKAEELNNEMLIQEYLKKQGLWDEFDETRQFITQYQNNMDSIEYLYIVAYGGMDADKDMYLVDNESEGLIEIGLYEEREPEFNGVDLVHMDTSVLSYSKTWGWLYSNYAPVYDDDGNVVALVGCDVDFTDVMNKRHSLLWFTIGYVTFFTILAIIIMLIMVDRVIVKPLKLVSDKIQEFRPRANMTKHDTAIIDLKFRTENEITTIANNVRELELNIVDFMYNLNIKDRQISQLDALSMRDSLTSVGNMRAYKDAMHRLNGDMEHNIFAICMADINNLKIINDTYGHKEGDIYIQTCCKMLCDTFKHSRVFRIGGDEFVVLVENEDYEYRHALYDAINTVYVKNFKDQTISINKRYSMSLGMADKLDSDTVSETVFKRADKIMYNNKKKVKLQKMVIE